MNTSLSVAIIGAGMAGVTLASLLHTAGVNVTVFDKGRGIGGRMSTRRNADSQYDHGAQFFTVRTPAFAHFLADYDDCFTEWDARVVTLSPNAKPYGRPWFEPHYVCEPAMNTLCKRIARNISVHTDQEIRRVTGTPGHWFLETDDAFSGPFEWVVSTAPLPQSTQLLPVTLPRATYAPVFALMAPLENATTYDAAVVKDSPLEWIAISSRKPGRKATSPALVAHATAEWSDTHFSLPKNDVKLMLTSSLEALNLKINPASAHLHRWRYGRVVQPADEPFFMDSNNQLAACGDWGSGSRVEDAFTSAFTLAPALLGAILETPSPIEA